MIAHRDIKPENFLLNENLHEFYIFNFGESCKLHESDCEILIDTPVGTPGYMSPELYDNF